MVCPSKKASNVFILLIKKKGKNQTLKSHKPQQLSPGLVLHIKDKKPRAR
jgi:hypothetical protein